MHLIYEEKNKAQNLMLVSNFASMRICPVGCRPKYIRLVSGQASGHLFLICYLFMVDRKEEAILVQTSIICK